jgi:hypothetical protein
MDNGMARYSLLLLQEMLLGDIRHAAEARLTPNP